MSIIILRIYPQIQIKHAYFVQKIYNISTAESSRVQCMYLKTIQIKIVSTNLGSISASLPNFVYSIKQGQKILYYRSNFRSKFWTTFSAHTNELVSVKLHPRFSFLKRYIILTIKSTEELWFLGIYTKFAKSASLRHKRVWKIKRWELCEGSLSKL